MKVLEPTTITDAILDSSTVPEPDTGEVIYDAGDAPYSLGDRVIVDHWLYESLTADNNAVPPSQTNSAEWLFRGASNRWKPFDLKRNDTSLGDSPYVLEFIPTERIAAVALAGLVGNTVQLEIINVSAETVYDETTTISVRTVVDTLTYLFEPFRQLQKTAFLDLPMGLTGATYRITIEGTGQVGLSAIGLGPVTEIGPVQYGAVDDALNFSKVLRDRDGNATFTPGRVVPTLLSTAIADKARTPSIRALRERTPATPVFWIGLDDSQGAYYGSLFLLGAWTRFAIPIENPGHNPINIEVENI